MALLDGLSLCNAMELWELDIECDSKVVVTAILEKDTPSWAYIQILRRCIASWRDNFEIRHIFREANIVADRCADLTHSYKTLIDYFSKLDLPAPIRRAIQSDRAGTFTYRPRLGWSLIVFCIILPFWACIFVLFTGVLFSLCWPVRFLTRPLPFINKI